MPREGHPRTGWFAKNHTGISYEAGLFDPTGRLVVSGTLAWTTEMAELLNAGAYYLDVFQVEEPDKFFLCEVSRKERGL